jgi:ketosteroid isomerase-like protein
MSAEENKTILLRFLQELGKGNLDIVDEVCSPDFAFHSPNFPDWPRGLEGARQLAVAGRSMFSDTRTTLEDIFAADDKVVIRAIYRFLNGKIVDDWGIQVSCPTDRPWG